MPSIKHRQKVTMADVKITEVRYRDVVIPWQELHTSGASVSGLSASIGGYSVGGSHAAMRITATANTCPLWTVRPVPADAAPSGSGKVILDWTDITTNSAVAVFAACLFAIPSGSAIGDTGASLLGSGCTALTGTSASEYNSGSILAFNAPATETALLALKLQRVPGDGADTSGSNLCLFDARLRYVVNRIGAS